MSIINAILVQRNPDIYDSQKTVWSDYLLISLIILATCFLSAFECSPKAYFYKLSFMT